MNRECAILSPLRRPYQCRFIRKAAVNQNLILCQTSTQPRSQPSLEVTEAYGYSNLPSLTNESHCTTKIAPQNRTIASYLHQPLLLPGPLGNQSDFIGSRLRAQQARPQRAHCHQPPALRRPGGTAAGARDHRQGRGVPDMDLALRTRQPHRPRPRLRHLLYIGGLEDMAASTTWRYHHRQDGSAHAFDSGSSDRPLAGRSARQLAARLVSGSRRSCRPRPPPASRFRLSRLARYAQSISALGRSERGGGPSYGRETSRARHSAQSR